MLCSLAMDDESTLQYPLPDQIYGFHAQQSCEKLFKALISTHDRDYPFTHELEKLLKLLVACGESLPSVPFAFERMEPFAVVLRYDFGPGLSADDRNLVRESVAILREHVVGRILELERIGRP